MSTPTRRALPAKKLQDSAWMLGVKEMRKGLTEWPALSLPATDGVAARTVDPDDLPEDFRRGITNQILEFLTHMYFLWGLREPLRTKLMEDSSWTNQDDCLQVAVNLEKAAKVRQTQSQTQGQSASQGKGSNKRFQCSSV